MLRKSRLKNSDNTEKLNESLFTIEQVAKMFHIDKDTIQPFDTLIAWDTIYLSESFLDNSLSSVFHYSCDDHSINCLVESAAYLELINYIEAAILFENLYVPTRKITVFNLSYSKNSITKHLVDEGILHVTFTDNVYRTHPRIDEIQTDMYNSLFENKLKKPNQSMFHVNHDLYDFLSWFNVLNGIYENGPKWVLDDYLESNGVLGDYGWAELMYKNTIHNFAVSKTLNTSIQPNIFQYPLSDLLINQSTNYKLPSAYLELIKTVRRNGFGKEGNNSNLSIPPISSYVLSTSKKPSDIIKKLFKLRKKFKSFRQRFREYQFVLDNEKDYHPDKLAQLKKKYWDGFLSDIETIGSKKESFVHIFDPLNVTLSSDETGSFSVSISVIELMEILKNGFILLMLSGNVRMLNNLYKATLNLPTNKSYLRLIGTVEKSNEFNIFIKNYTNYILNQHKDTSFIFEDFWK